MRSWLIRPLLSDWNNDPPLLLPKNLQSLPFKIGLTEIFIHDFKGSAVPPPPNKEDDRSWWTVDQGDPGVVNSATARLSRGLSPTLPSPRPRASDPHNPHNPPLSGPRAWPPTLQLLQEGPMWRRRREAFSWKLLRLRAILFLLTFRKISFSPPPRGVYQNSQGRRVK